MNRSKNLGSTTNKLIYILVVNIGAFAIFTIFYSTADFEVGLCSLIFALMCFIIFVSLGVFYIKQHKYIKFELSQNNGKLGDYIVVNPPSRFSYPKIIFKGEDGRIYSKYYALSKLQNRIEKKYKVLYLVKKKNIVLVDIMEG